MSFLKPSEIESIKSKLEKDLSILGKIYKAKKSQYMFKSVDHSLVSDLVTEGWEEYKKPGKTKTYIRKDKIHSKKFEDDIWCQYYELGYRCLNFDDTFSLPYGKDPEDKKQIDVIAVDQETVFLIECKSSETSKRAPSLKTEFEGLEKRINGFRKSIDQIFGKGLRLKYVYATRKLRVNPEGIEIKRLKKTNSFYYNDNTYDYINSLIIKYKGAAKFQFLGLVFKDQLINSSRIEVPAIEGDMGGKTYYMFSIEPVLLLKMGFILHRTKANQSEMPTYQRLLVPSRLKGISKFINEGGYFPNSIIINFSQRKHKIQFEASARSGDSSSRFGMLKIPNAYAVAYIIDGQHRVYGYANTVYQRSNTIPVVAFVDLDSTEQLGIFMDINQNQKAVSPDLRLTLEEDLFWDSPRLDSRLKALKSSIIKELAESQGPLFNKISVGEDKSFLSFKAYYNALTKCGLLPAAKGNSFVQGSAGSALYNTNNQDHNTEMLKAKADISEFINLCYEFVENNYNEVFSKEQYFIISNRGTYAFITTIGALNKHLSEIGILDYSAPPQKRFDEIEKYLIVLLDQLKNLDPEEEKLLLSYFGTGADIRWSMTFQSYINSKFEDFAPLELIDWRERLDKDLQNEGRVYGESIEKHMKTIVIEKLKFLFGDNWDIEIGKIQRECEHRAKEEIERQYKEGLGRKHISWTEMFFINDYKEIISKYWGNTPDSVPEGFRKFEDEFSIDVGLGFHSKAEKLKWISKFNSLRSLWAHAGTKEKGLNKEEVEFLKTIYLFFGSE